MTTPEQDLRRAIGRLGRTAQRAYTVALVEARDRAATTGDPMADVYASLAALTADITDGETRVLRAMQNDYDGPPTTA
ncbi:hypothetical protein O1L60_10645 [Streptomyces diastatochromogenes]|nr:hypothetical protein [Streptomyces diastatochromogenes]